ncbi:DNA polymerase alpha subunit B N-terminal-domain-containing protein [Dipodascopsis uninucleata]
MPSTEYSSSISSFFDGKLPEDLEAQCLSMQKSFALTPDDLFFKIEAYQIDRGLETTLTKEILDELRMDLQRQLERKQKQKAAVNGNYGNSSSPVQGITPVKRKFPGSVTTPSNLRSSPLTERNSSFATRTDAGKVLEMLNSTIEIDTSELGIEKAKITAFMDVKKYHYRTMRQGLLEVSEYLDDRIEQFAEAFQKYLEEDKEARHDEVLLSASERTGNPAAISHSEIIVVGRIVSDSVHAADSSKLNEQSILLESCRRIGSGSRVPLQFTLRPNPSKWAMKSFSLFPGQIVALRGTNPTGERFIVGEFLKLPELPFPVSPTRVLSQTANRPTRLIVAKGPFSPQDDLSFDPLKELITQCIKAKADVVMLLGPFVDSTHQSLLNPSYLPYSGLNTLEDLFRACISTELNRLENALPNCQAFLITECGKREAIQKHLSFPSPPLTDTRKSLGMPKRSRWLCNPAFIAANSTVFAVANIDTLMQLVKVECMYRDVSDKTAENSAFVRAIRCILQQRSLYPVFPSQAGVPQEISYMGLAEMNIARPDVLIVPSEQKYFAKVVDNVVAINPGVLTKARAAGTYALLDIAPIKDFESRLGSAPNPESDPEKLMMHRVWERCRVDIKKI